jgi:hypothetical protein
VRTSTLFPDQTKSVRKTLHIIDTIFLAGNEVLVHFSDGTAAIYEAEELEKLRPAPKQLIPAQPVYANIA